ncbi:PDZ domain-containing protein [Neorhodopirellula lusitana]|uniref:PDZ domain-containing protein n=1 Tax=Neorhodopirellula lusitana TaxID=445327 RepID=A0ABY1QAW0_9BACT|nr:PDZ domain-containing protein [Neorhodopirellula lusitana]SMP65989.1 PDZ domain-containing protein [Neorhodopirellula lusitana]
MTFVDKNRNRIQPFSLTRTSLAQYLVLTLVVLTCCQTTASAQDDSPIPEWLQQRLVDRVLHRRDSNAMMRLMNPIAEKAEASVVEVISGGRPVALGTVVSLNSSSDQLNTTTAPSSDPSVVQDAYIVTKRSELSGDPIRIRLADGRLIPARVAAVRRRSDLALLVAQVDQATKVRSLQPVHFDRYVPLIGSFLISPDRTGRVIGLGVVGAAPRKVSHKGRLGIELERISQTGARVRNIIPDSGADEAGLERGDRIIAIDGRNQNDVRQVVSTLNGMFPGEVVQLTIERDGSTVDIPARMGELAVMQESENDARVNGARNIRLSGFEQAIQHDMVLNPEQCGGPVLDTEGRVIGLNIARAGRVVSYALPASLVASEVSSMIAEAGGK